MGVLGRFPDPGVYSRSRGVLGTAVILSTMLESSAPVSDL